MRGQAAPGRGSRKCDGPGQGTSWQHLQGFLGQFCIIGPFPQSSMLLTHPLDTPSQKPQVSSRSQGKPVHCSATSCSSHHSSFVLQATHWWLWGFVGQSCSRKHQIEPQPPHHPNRSFIGSTPRKQGSLNSSLCSCVGVTLLQSDSSCSSRPSQASRLRGNGCLLGPSLFLVQTHWKTSTAGQF